MWWSNGWTEQFQRGRMGETKGEGKGTGGVKFSMWISSRTDMIDWES